MHCCEKFFKILGRSGVLLLELPVAQERDRDGTAVSRARNGNPSTGENHRSEHVSPCRRSTTHKLASAFAAAVTSRPSTKRKKASPSRGASFSRTFAIGHYPNPFTLHGRQRD
jgi:hypothetical protein